LTCPDDCANNNFFERIPLIPRADWTRPFFFCFVSHLVHSSRHSARNTDAGAPDHSTRDWQLGLQHRGAVEFASVSLIVVVCLVYAQTVVPNRQHSGIPA
jgi:hypothetical protein